MNKYDQGYGDACTAILGLIDARKKSYRANQLHQKYYAVDLLHRDINEFCECKPKGPSKNRKS